MKDCKYPWFHGRNGSDRLPERPCPGLWGLGFATHSQAKRDRQRRDEGARLPYGRGGAGSFPPARPTPRDDMAPIDRCEVDRSLSAHMGVFAMNDAVGSR